jgi:hypothetical protein
MLDAILKNWKTTVAGLAVIGLTVRFAMGGMSTDAFLSLLGVLAGGGFMLSGDGKAGDGK